MEFVTLANDVAELSGVVILTSADIMLNTDGRDCSFICRGAHLFVKQTHQPHFESEKTCSTLQFRIRVWPIVLTFLDVFKPLRGLKSVDKIKKHRRDPLGEMNAPWASFLASPYRFGEK